MNSHNSHNSHDSIYISGYSGRFPDSPDIHALFENLSLKRDCVSQSKRYPKGYLGLPDRAGHVSNRLDAFDQTFFKMNKMHVDGMDIQIRMLLEVVYEAILDSNLSIEKLQNTNTGVYVGNCFSDYHNGILQSIHNVNGYENLGSAISMSANKISHFFNLTGPSIAIDTACSSAMYALSIACDDLVSGKIDRAIVAGVSLNLRPVVSSVFQKYNMLSPDGTCFSFDERANGYCRSESINAIILQRDFGYAKIIGYGVNANGTTEQGIAFPNVHKQTELFESVCSRFHIEKSKIEYIESHGTGTNAGDNAEITALDTVYGSPNKTIHIGSIKSSLGHAEGASGLNSIIKCLMMYESEIMLPNIHYKSTSHMPILENRFKVVDEIVPFHRGFVAVNNFGFGGTNAHFILANGNYEYDIQKITKNTQKPNITKVCSRTKEGCMELLHREFISSSSFESIDTTDLDKFYWYGAKLNLDSDSVSKVNPEIEEQQIQGKTEQIESFLKINNMFSKPSLVYIFSGQGSNYIDMAKELFLNNNIFHNTITRLSDFLLEMQKENEIDSKLENINLLDLFQNGQDWLNKSYSSIGISAVQIGLVNILTDQHIVPDFIIGHSMGEIACSYADGCLTEYQCIYISYIRSLLVNMLNKNTNMYNYTNDLSSSSNVLKNLDIEYTIISSDPTTSLYTYQVDKSNADVFESAFPNYISKFDNHGKMLFVSATEDKIAPYLSSNYPNVCIACYNSNDGLTLSGPFFDVIEIEKEFTEKQIFCRDVETDGIAYHSVLLKPYKNFLLEKISKIIPCPRKRSEKWLSTCTGPDEDIQPLCDAMYHTNNIIRSVRFYQEIENLQNKTKNTCVFIEISPNTGLLGQIKRTRSKIPSDQTILLSTLTKKTSDKNTEDMDKLFVNLWIHRIHATTKSYLPNCLHLPMKYRYTMKWDHSESHKIVDFENFESSDSTRIDVTYHLKGEHAFLFDHQINQKSLFPAMGHLYTLWKIIGLTNPISCKNMQIMKAIVLDNSMTNLVFQVDKNKNKNKEEEDNTTTTCYEIYYEGEIVASAIIENLKNTQSKKPPSSIFCSDMEIDSNPSRFIKHSMFYGMLSRYGYNYKSQFRMIDFIDSENAYIRKTAHWITLLDGMLQASVQSASGLFLPTSIESIHIYDPDLKMENLVIQHRKKDLIIEYAVHIHGLQTTHAPYSHDIIESSKKSVEFIPYECLVNNNVDYLDICVQLIEENMNISSAHVIEVVTEHESDHELENASENVSEHNHKNKNKNTPITSFLTYFQDRVGQYTKNTHEQFLTSANTIRTLDCIYLNNIENAVFTDIELEIVSNKITNGGFILLHADDDIFIRFNWINTKFTKIAVYINENTHTGYYLFRKIYESVIYKIVSIDDCICSPKPVDESGSTRNIFSINKHVIINSPCDGFVKSIHKEPGYENNSIICAYTYTNACSLNNNNNTYNHKKDNEDAIDHALTTQMRINICKNGICGTYRMIDTDSNKIVYVLEYPDFEIRINKPGMLQSLTRYEIPNDTTHTIRTHFCGLNFKDVMLSYGKLKIDPSKIKLGLEFSGRNKYNESVMGMGIGVFKTTIPTKDVISWKIPIWWTMEEAATVPCVYSTVYYALDYKCRIQPENSILIHAGSGGIGQAAIHICMKRGIRVYTTCSPGKREFLKQKFGLSDSQIGNSRDSSFYEWIMEQTGGCGVDIVLNSLSEEKLLLSLKCVKEFGQFCEIGKYDVLNNTNIGIHVFERNISFHVIDLSFMFSNTQYKNILFDLVQTGLNNKEIEPLNIDRVFHCSKIDEAIRYMGSGTHTGKIVIHMLPERDSDGSIVPLNVTPRFYTSGIHMISGGMGGFGMELGEWLIGCGAEKVLLLGRSGIQNLHQHNKLSAYGSKIEFVSVDITNETTVKNLFSMFDPASIVGIWHLAMILNDKLYANMTEREWKDTIHVKIRGAELLDKYSPTDCLFTCWSSISSLFGNAGQTNYAYGNYKMEELCRNRRKHGKNGVAICWGTIDNIGVLSQESAKLNHMSFLPQNIDDCLEDLHFLLHKGRACSVLTCYKKNTKDTTSQNTSDLSLMDKVLSILGLDVSKSDSMNKNLTLTEMGMDSLQLASIKNILKSHKNIDISNIYNLKLCDIVE
jgi:3-oxoacyl-(acyl-carrier-protein) synthase/NADPH:quinone reductase-like Zn-dependent oxidoreductase/malonyl CoA-acyl carrier protein transacylase